MARCTSYVIRGKKLAVIILINGFLLTGMVAQNLGENGHVVLGGKNTIENPRALSSVYVFIPDNSEQRLTINPWYGVVSPANKTQVISPENTPAKIISVPYILPVFWVITLAEINPYLPAAVEVILYSSVFTLLLFPLWYKKSVIGGNGKKIRLHRLIIQWKRNLRLVKRY